MNVLKPHVSLNVSDIDASVSFYEKVLALAPTKCEASVMDGRAVPRATACCEPGCCTPSSIIDAPR